jgi:uncharacterized Zn finger protein
MAVSLKRALSAGRVRELAGAAAFERGRAYVLEGRVSALSVAEREATARVAGAQAYEVRLWLKGAAVQHSCTCPAAREGAFCKHCAAVGLLLGG